MPRFTDVGPDLMSFNDLVARAVELDPIAIHPTHERGLRAQAGHYLANVEALTPAPITAVRTSTLLLQALDFLLQREVERLRERVIAPPASGGSLAARRWQTDLQGLAAGSATADRLRRLRRRALAHGLAAYRSGALDWTTLLETVVRPLVDRAWLPRAIYEPLAPGERWPPGESGTGVWHPRATERWRELRERLGSNPPPEGDIVPALSAALRDWDDPGVRQALAYLLAADATVRTWGGHGGIEAPLLLTADQNEWPLGHIVTALLLPGQLHGAFGPHIPGTAGNLSAESLQSARLALGDRGDVDADAMLVLADYPGGTIPPRQVSGPSAGLALAAAMLAQSSALTWQPGVLATAAIALTGQVLPLGDPHGLAQKARAALLSGHDALVVAAGARGDDPPDVDVIQATVTPFARPFEVRALASLADIGGPLLVDPYAGLLTGLLPAPALVDASLETALDHLTAELLAGSPEAHERRVAAIPWTGAQADTAALALRAIAGRLAAAAAGAGPDRVIPLPVGPSVARALREASEGPVAALPHLLAQSLPGAPASPGLAALLGDHLRTGRLLLLLDGLADHATGGDLMTEIDAARLLDTITAWNARALLITRAGGDAVHPISARQAALERAGFLTTWLMPPTAPAHPLTGHQIAILTGDHGPAMRHLPSLRIAALDLSPDHPTARRSLAEQFLLPDEPAAASRSLPPRAARAFEVVTPALEPTGVRLDESAILARLSDQSTDSAGVILLDGVGEGGWGKTTQLLALLANAARAGRPALYLSLGEATSWPAVAPDESLLSFALRATGIDDPAAELQVLSQGVFLLLDDIDAVPDPLLTRFAAIAPVLARALTGHDPAVTALVTSRSEPWLADGAPEQSPDAWPAPAQLRAALARQTDADGGQPMLISLVPQPGMLPRAADSRRTISLPAPPNALLGRVGDLRAIRALLRQPETRLVTLTGPGGVGKTRLALQIARDVADLYADGAVFVDLSTLDAPEQVETSIAQALDLPSAGDEPVGRRLAAELASKQLLLVLDNFEQVIEAAPLIARLLAAAPRVRILATSRARLQLQAEQEYPLPPLQLPDPRRTLSPESALEVESVAFLLDRIRRVRPDLELTPDNLDAARDIAIRLDGLPLAIELAAARARLFPLPQLLARLERALPELTGGSRDLPSRQRTLVNAIAWSHELLSDDERILFRRLAVFAGGFTLDAAIAINESIPGPVTDTITGLDGLIDQSLVQRTAGDESRFRMLEMIREYASLRLAESDEVAAVHAAHAAWFLELAESSRDELSGPDQAAWLRRLEADLGNLRRAFSLTLEQEDSGRVLAAAGALWQFWVRRGYAREGWSWLSQALAADVGGEQDAARGDALLDLGSLALELDDYPRARELYGASLEIWRALGDEGGIASTLNNLGRVELVQGDYAAAERSFQEGLAAYREIESVQGEAYARDNLGDVARAIGDLPAAREHHEAALALLETLDDPDSLAYSYHKLGVIACDEGRLIGAAHWLNRSLALFRELDDRFGESYALHALGDLARVQGEREQALAWYREALALSWELRDRLGTIESIEGWATQIADTEPSTALRYLTAASAQRTRLGTPRRPALERRLNSALGHLTNTLDPQLADIASAEGRAASLEAIVIAITSDEPG